MSRLKFHGNAVTGITDLQQLLGCAGNNGEEGGVIKLTDDLQKAINHAKGGSVYLIDTDPSYFLKIDKQTMLTPEQADTIAEILFDADELTSTQLLTELLGKQETTFHNDGDAEIFYKHEMQHFEEYKLHVEESKQELFHPEFKLNERGQEVVRSARKKIDTEELEYISTERLHIILNDFNNQFATSIISRISKGVISTKGSYAILHGSVPVEAEINISELSNEEVLNRVKSIELGSQTIDLQFTREGKFSADQAGKISYRDAWSLDLNRNERNIRCYD